MRDSLRVLTVSGALVLAVAFGSAMAQTESAPQQSGTSTKPMIGINGSILNGSPVPSAAAPQAPAAPESKPATDANLSNDSSPTQDSDAVKDSNTATDPGAPQFDHGAGSAGVPAVAVSSADKKKALSILRRSTRDYEACKRSCFAYFDSFGVAFSFADGAIAAYSHEQRGKISGHDCVVNARNAQERGDRSLAVQWMMAAQADILNRNWIADHPDAMLEALRTFRGWA